MYLEFYGLKENPFNITADPEFFYSSRRHREAYYHLLYGITQRKGISVLTGEVGTGKTTLCRKVLSQLDHNVRTAYLLNPNFSDLELLQFIIKDFGISGRYKNKLELVTALNEFLLKENERGNNVVIIIDEAQNLSVNQLEQVRLLSNLETDKDKLLQIMLVGQPELDEKLKLSELRQLNQRIAVHFSMDNLNINEVTQYINHRLEVAGSGSDPLMNPKFTKEAFEAIQKICNGVPRTINILCDRALLAGFVDEQRSIDKELIERSAEEIGLTHCV